MGGLLSSAPSSPVSGQVEEILRRLETTRIEREIAIQEAIERRRRAYEIAREREAFTWWASGGGLTSVFAALSSYHHKNLLHVLPLVPIATFVGYKAHLCYGEKQKLLNVTATELLRYEADTLSTVPLTADDVRRRAKELAMAKEY